MSREILFKAKRANWRELLKEEWWVEGNLVWSNDSFEEYRAIIIPKENSDMFTKSENNDLGFKNWYLVDPETVCQYTGLTDKNGKKIFENDIANVVFLEAREGALAKTYQYKVEFDQEEASYELTGNDELLGRPCFVSANQSLMEIIGNIFDNPEYLKQAAVGKPITDEWIPCSDRLPKEPSQIPLTTEEVERMIENGILQECIVTMHGAKKSTMLYYAGNGEWYDPVTAEFYDVIAWQPLPDPYKPNNQAAVQKGDNQ